MGGSGHEETAVDRGSTSSFSAFPVFNGASSRNPGLKTSDRRPPQRHDRRSPVLLPYRERVRQTSVPRFSTQVPSQWLPSVFNGGTHWEVPPVMADPPCTCCSYEPSATAHGLAWWWVPPTQSPTQDGQDGRRWRAPLAPLGESQDCGDEPSDGDLAQVDLELTGAPPRPMANQPVRSRNSRRRRQPPAGGPPDVATHVLSPSPTKRRAKRP